MSSSNFGSPKRPLKNIQAVCVFSQHVVVVCIVLFILISAIEWIENIVSRIQIRSDNCCDLTFLHSDAYEHIVHNSECAADTSPSFEQKFVSVDWAVVVVPLGVPFGLFLSFFDDDIETGGGYVLWADRPDLSTALRIRVNVFVFQSWLCISV